MGKLNEFWKIRRAKVSLLFICVAALFSFTAELWSNSKPILLRYNGEWFVPVFKHYSPDRFGIEGAVTVNYRELELKDSDFALWTINKWNPFESNTEVASYPSGPSRSNWLGTDDRGRDLFSRLLYGFRYSLLYAFFVWAITVVLAVVIGGLMGYFGGWVDLIGQRLVEVLNTVPVFFLLIILVSLFDPTLTLLIILTSLFSWIGLSYYLRAEFLKNRRREFVEAARALGASHTRLIFKHILPNSLVPVVTFSPFIISGQILGLASLDYLGFGLRVPTPSWGELLHQAQTHFQTAWWLAVYPSFALFVTLVACALVGEGVRRVFDPKSTR